MKNTYFSKRSLAALFMAISITSTASAQDLTKVMVLTGQSSRYHSWQKDSAAFKKILDQAGIFDVDVVTAPARGEDMSGFAPNWPDYAAVVLDYEGDEWPASTKESFVEYMKNGGGLVVVHATNNAFPNWPEFLEMTGVGGWGGRNESSGPKVRWRDGQMVLDSETPGNATHPAKHDFQVVTRAPDHPIMQGLPAVWMHSNDELYSQLRGPAKNLTVLATASADRSRRGTGENEPMLMTIKYGEGRVFHTTLGHVGPNDQEPVDSVSCVGFIVTLQRGTEWAATGSVTQSVPEDFPTADATSLRN